MRCSIRLSVVRRGLLRVLLLVRGCRPRRRRRLTSRRAKGRRADLRRAAVGRLHPRAITRSAKLFDMLLLERELAHE